MRNIVLIGLSGSGKTSLGKAAAARAAMAFRDMDAEIEKSAAMSVSAIFAHRGEEAFRDMEAEEAIKAASAASTVISTGGGAVLREENMRRLSEKGFVIFIDRSPELIAARISRKGRPLLADGTDRLFAMSRERRPLYLKYAQAVLENDGGFAQALEGLSALIASQRPGQGFAVIGDPIGHTQSPAIHKAVFALCRPWLGQEAGREAGGTAGQGAAGGNGGPRWDYRAVHVKRGRLGDFIEAALESGLRGFNVTIPHKRDIIEFIDDIDDDARLCGAVNTVLIEGGRLKGHNTDLGGLHEAIKGAGHDYRDARVVVLGAGGAAAGVAFKAAKEGAAQVRLLGRRPEQALELAGQVRQALGESGGGDGPGQGQAEILGGAMAVEDLRRAAAGADVLVNATPLGMAGAGGFEGLDFLEALPKAALVCDLVYAPPETALLKRARELGLKAMNGMAMLVYQALLADELYMGRSLDKRPLYEYLTGILRNPI